MVDWSSTKEAKFIICTSYSSTEQSSLLSTCICNTSSSYLMGVIVCEAVVTLSTCLCFAGECTWPLCEYLAVGQHLWMGQQLGYRALIVLHCGMGCMLGPGSSERNGATTHKSHWGERVHGGGGLRFPPFTHFLFVWFFFLLFSLPLYTPFLTPRAVSLWGNCIPWFVQSKFSKVIVLHTFPVQNFQCFFFF